LRLRRPRRNREDRDEATEQDASSPHHVHRCP
jgi:hypothetical protein